MKKYYNAVSQYVIFLDKTIRVDKFWIMLRDCIYITQSKQFKKPTIKFHYHHQNEFAKPRPTSDNHESSNKFQKKTTKSISFSFWKLFVFIKNKVATISNIDLAKRGSSFLKQFCEKLSKRIRQSANTYFFKSRVDQNGKKKLPFLK